MKPVIIIALFAVAIALWLCESDNTALFLATKAVALGITIGTCRLYDRWEKELNQPVK